jgi:flagellar biosynthesis/type III secretory pathway M-ring protein FliF/YscJ
MFDSLGHTLKNSVDQIGRLSPNARLLVIMSVLLIGCFLFIISIYASKPQRVEIGVGTDAAYKSEALSQLQGAGIEASISNGSLMVKKDDINRASGLLAERGVLPADGTLLFQNLSEQMKWTNPREVNQQMMHMALQNELARTISNFPTLKKASVFLDIPTPTGIGMVVRQPTASVTVFSQNGSVVRQNQVDAIAKLVSHAVAGLDLSGVSVIDGTSGTPLQARSDDNALATNYLEHKKNFEHEVEQKVRGILSSIPGALVAVSADVDVKQVTSRREAFLPEKQGTVSVLSSTTSTSEKSLGASQGAESGTRPNTGADITQSNSSAGGFESSDTKDDFESRVGSEVTSTVDPRGMATSLSISVQVPRGYIEALLPVPEGATEDTPAVYDDAAVDAKFETERERIARLIEPHLPTTVADGGGRVAAGSVVVSMMPIDLVALAGSTQAATLGLSSMGSTATGGGGALGGIMANGMIEKGLLLVLAVGAFGMMFFMVKGATKRVALPSVEELVGIPPALDNQSDVVGEADESETPMDGIEVDDSHVANSKMLEQVGDLVGTEPDLAARLLNRWIQP